MRIFIYAVLAAVIMTGLMFWCNRHEITRVQHDFQAYQNTDILKDL